MTRTLARLLGTAVLGAALITTAVPVAGADDSGSTSLEILQELATSPVGDGVWSDAPNAEPSKHTDTFTSPVPDLLSPGGTITRAGSWPVRGEYEVATSTGHRGTLVMDDDTYCAMIADMVTTDLLPAKLAKDKKQRQEVNFFRKIARLTAKENCATFLLRQRHAGVAVVPESAMLGLRTFNLEGWLKTNQTEADG